MSTTPLHSEPAWAIAKLFPDQGYWDEEEYLALAGNKLVEYVDGFIEVPSMPTDRHQAIVAFLFQALLAFLRANDLGKVRFAPLRLRTLPNHFREPDILVLLKSSGPSGDRYWRRADLVVEVVSDDPEDRKRDLETKRVEYAKAGIPEYWIVDPQVSTITVLKLDQDAYSTHDEFVMGATATSVLLAGSA